MIQPGEQAPAFELRDQQGERLIGAEPLSVAVGAPSADRYRPATSRRSRSVQAMTPGPASASASRTRPA
jgi:hypothetical protein